MNQYQINVSLGGHHVFRTDWFLDRNTAILAFNTLFNHLPSAYKIVMIKRSGVMEDVTEEFAA